MWPVRVQGEQCAAEVAAAIRGFNTLKPDGAIPRPDIIIVARGGGSIEDLWGFNEEIVVRAAAASAIPLVSAVGHETDWTLLDLAADRRCPTPTAAAECAVPVRVDLIAEVASLAARLRRGWQRLGQERRARVTAAGRALPRRDEVLAFVRQRFDGAGGRLKLALRANTKHHRSDFDRASARLAPNVLRRESERLMRDAQRHGKRLVQARTAVIEGKRRSVANVGKLLATLSHRSVLKRGFALVTANAVLVPDRAAALPGADVAIEFHDGTVEARIGNDSGRPPRKTPRGGGQGSLL